MKVRLVGLPDEVTAAADAIRPVLDVISVSRPYARRGDTREISVYIEARPLAGQQQNGEHR